MTTFVDGPAAGQTLMLRRSVVFLRVTRKRFALETEKLSGRPLPFKYQKADQFDALDQPEDTPAPDEELFCYLNTGKRRGAAMVDFGGNKKHLSGRYVMAEYALYRDQPPDEVMRDTGKWRAWCERQAELNDIKHS